MSSAFNQVAEAIAAEDAWVRVSSRQLNGPGTLAAVLSDHHPTSEDFTHVDVGIVFDRNNPASPIAWDCVGFPATQGELWLEQSVARWRKTAFATARDVTTHSADGVLHLDAGDAAGLKDYHCVFTSVAFGSGPLEELAQWAVENPILPAIEERVIERFFHPVVNTVRFSYGGGEHSTAVDVFINGEFDHPAADIVTNMSWPRVEASLVKAYAICIEQTV